MRLKISGLLLCALVFGCEGAEGPTGPAGTNGDAGAVGAQGSQGEDGPQGTEGAEGAEGAQGAEGTEGAEGAQGAEGAEGAEGAQGAEGAEGAEGARGEPGLGYIERDPDGVIGYVRDTSGAALVGATVLLIPADAIDRTIPVVADFAADATNDEPLEDLARVALADLDGSGYPYALTNDDGIYHFDTVPADGSWFMLVWPHAEDTAHAPGGSACRVAQSSDALVGERLDLEMSFTIPAGAEYVGSSVCTNCHGRSHQAETMMANGFRLMHGNVGRQRLEDSRHPGYALARAKFAAGTSIYFYNPDMSRGFDKYLTSESDPGFGNGAVDQRRVLVTLRRDGDDYFATLTNLADPTDAASGTEWQVEFAYGGGVYKQRYVININGSRYMLPFQFQVEGDDNYPSRTRTDWRDYHLDYWFSEDTMTLKTPALVKSFDKNCAGCHFTGYSMTGDAESGYRAAAVDDPGGLFDYDGNGFPDEMNVGCESCHGPGSAHWNSAGQGKYIVSPSLLTPGRETAICGACHSRPQGATGSDNPVNADEKMPIPGISRADYIAEHTNRADAAPGSLWGDARQHSKSHHQQYTDLLRSTHYKNSTHLLSCSNCHDPHGTENEWNLRLPAEDGVLCGSCHADTLANLSAHTAEEVGVDHSALGVTCVDCHMVKTSKSGAGGPGRLAGADQYWHNDISSHMFDVPRKGVIAGVAAADAMPIPYTNACGACHAAFPATE